MFTTQQDVQRKILFDTIRVIVLFDEHVPYSSWSNDDVHSLNILLAKETVTHEEVLELIHQRILEIGRQCFVEHERGCEPDHTNSPYAFAYALYHNMFTPAEKLFIKPDFGGTVEDFIKQYYKEDLPEKVFTQMCTIRDLTNLKSSDCCFCC